MDRDPLAGMDAHLWSVGFGWIGVRLPQWLSPILSLVMFVTLLVIGTALRSKHRLTKRSVGHFLALGLGYLVWFFGLSYSIPVSFFQYFNQLENQYAREWAVPLLVHVIPFCAIVLWPKDRLQRFLMFLFVFSFWFIMVFIPYKSLGGRLQLSGIELSVAIYGAGLLPAFAFFAILSFAPLIAVNKRLLFVAMGTLCYLRLTRFLFSASSTSLRLRRSSNVRPLHPSLHVGRAC